MSLEALTWVLKHSEEKLGRRLVLLALADYAHDDGSRAYPSVQTLARKARLSERQVQRCLTDMIRGGSIVQTGVTPKGMNVYRIVGVTDWHPLGVTNAASQMSPDPVKQDDPVDSELLLLSEPPVSTDLKVWAAWQEVGPIKHRDPHFENDKVRRAIAKAVKENGVDDVCAAIRLYAEVLESPNHYWNHPWPIEHFLNRGLTQFLPEAKPLEAFRERTAKPAPRQEFQGDLSRFDT